MSTLLSSTEKCWLSTCLYSLLIFTLEAIGCWWKYMNHTWLFSTVREIKIYTFTALGNKTKINIQLLALKEKPDRKSGWCSERQSRLPPLLQMLYVDWVSVDLTLTLRVFSGFLRFPPPSKSTPSLIHLAVVLCSKVTHGPYSGCQGRLSMLSVWPHLSCVVAVLCDGD